MQKLPLVSIIVRTLNRPKMLSEALHSIALQTYPHVEAIVINDGGCSLKEVLHNLPFKPEYQLIELEKNLGRCQAGNLGIENARGEFIGFLDDDDILYPDHISTLFNGLQDNDAVIYSDALQATQAHDQHSAHYKTVGFTLRYSERHSLKRMLEGNFIPLQCLLFKKQILLNEKLDTAISVLEDWDLLIRLSEKYSFQHLPVITSEYRLRLDNSNTTGSMPAVWQSTRKYLNNKYRELVRSQGLKYIPVK